MMRFAAAAAGILLLCLALSGCRAPTLRQSLCITPAPGAQLCQYVYDGDEAAP